MTELVLITDRSSSMKTIYPESIKALNNYVKEQKDGPDSCFITSWSFGNDVTKDISRQNIKTCGEIQHIVHGWTALYDAVGKAIEDMEAHIKKSKKKKTVLFVIQTDGGENASKEYRTLQSIAEKVKQAQDKGWQFVFLGANFMEKQGLDIGIPLQASLGFSQDPQSYQASYNVTSTETRNLRKAASEGKTYSISVRK